MFDPANPPFEDPPSGRDIERVIAFLRNGGDAPEDVLIRVANFLEFFTGQLRATFPDMFKEDPPSAT